MHTAGLAEGRSGTLSSPPLHPEHSGCWIYRQSQAPPPLLFLGVCQFWRVHRSGVIQQCCPLKNVVVCTDCTKCFHVEILAHICQVLCSYSAHFPLLSPSIDPFLLDYPLSTSLCVCVCVCAFAYVCVLHFV